MCVVLPYLVLSSGLKLLQDTLHNVIYTFAELPGTSAELHTWRPYGRCSLPTRQLGKRWDVETGTWFCCFTEQMKTAILS